MSRYFANNADYVKALREQYEAPHPAVQIAQNAVATNEAQISEAERELLAAVEEAIWHLERGISLPGKRLRRAVDGYVAAKGLA